MRKFLIFIIASLLTVHYVLAQEEDTELNIALKKLTDISLNGNVEGMAELTSPRLINAMGGKENALKLFKEAFLSLGNQGLKIDTVLNYNEPKIYVLGNIRYRFIPQQLIMSIPDKTKKMIGVTSLLALREPNVDRWTFIDYNGLSNEQLDVLLPEFKGKVDFPRDLPEKPLVIPKEKVTEASEGVMAIIDEYMTKHR